MRPTITHGYAEPLRAAEHDVSAHFAWRLEQGETHQVSRYDCDCLMAMQLLDSLAEVRNVAQHGRVLEYGAEQFRFVDLIKTTDYQFKAEVLSSGLNHIDSLWEAAGIHKKLVGVSILAHTLGERHAFRCCGSFVK